MADLQRATYLAPTATIDSDHPAVIEFARAAAGSAASEREAAVAIFYAVRDGVRYDPYAFDLELDTYRASRTLATRRSFCMPKAILLAAAARVLSIPSRLAFADVRNHLAPGKLLEMMRTDVFAFHGYTELRLGGRWVKATPAFDRRLCERFGVPPLEFNGVDDAELQPFDGTGERFMEYVVDRGRHADLPFDEIVRVTRVTYPHLFDAGGKLAGWGEGRSSGAERATAGG